MESIEVQIPGYSPESGMKYKWEEDFEIRTRIDADAIIIKVNRAGLISLANHLLNLAQEQIPAGHHMHFDEYNSLEGGSIELVIEKSIDKQN